MSNINQQAISVTIQASSPQEFRQILLGLLGTTSSEPINVTVNNSAPSASTPAASAKRNTTVVERKTASAETTPPADHDVLPTDKVVLTEPKEVKPEAAPKAAGKAAPKKAEATGGDAPAGPQLPDEIKNTNSMRDLITYLHDKAGVDSADAMVATCEVLKKEIPMLSKVPNVKDRVERALAVLGLFPETAAQD